MTANTPYERDASHHDTPDPRQNTSTILLVPHCTCGSSVPKWSHVRAHTSGTSHPLNNCMPESQLRGSTHGLEAPPSRLGYLGRSQAPGVHRPLNMCPSRRRQPSCKHTVHTSIHTVSSRSRMQQQRTHSWRLGWLPAIRFRLSCLCVLWLLPLLLHAC